MKTPAGFWIRFVAAIVDGFVLLLVTLPVTAVCNWLPAVLFGQGAMSALGSGVGFLINMGIQFAYYDYFYRKQGATPGKKAFGLQVISLADGSFPRPGQTALRELLGKAVSILIFGIGYLMAAFRKDKRALHDLMADTQVVYATERTRGAM